MGGDEWLINLGSSWDLAAW